MLKWTISTGTVFHCALVVILSRQPNKHTVPPWSPSTAWNTNIAVQVSAFDSQRTDDTYVACLYMLQIDVLAVDFMYELSLRSLNFFPFYRRSPVHLACTEGGVCSTS